ncbi:MAG: hypothetical protein HY534_01125 [Chloroflexi bacterium]|nr:hypothetical protein [Chloroflexota bacterium]
MVDAVRSLLSSRIEAFRREERGAIAFLVALLLPVLGGMGALVTDLGDVWQVRRHLQNCADAAALAGAWELGSQTLARTVATNYLTLQGIDACGTSPTFGFLDRNADGTSDALEVRATRTTSLGLARLIGINGGRVQARAVAGKITPSAFLGTEPFGVQVDPNQACGKADIQEYTLNGRPLRHGETYTVKYGAGGDSGAPGNFQPLALGGTGGSEYRTNIETGYPDWLSSCNTVLTKTGNMVGPTIAGLDQRMANGFEFMSMCDPALRGERVRWSECPRILNVAIIPPMGNGRSDVQVLTFGWFYLLGYSRDGNQSAELTGILLNVADKTAPPEEWTGSNAWSPNSSVPFGVKLLE